MVRPLVLVSALLAACGAPAMAPEAGDAGIPVLVDGGEAGDLGAPFLLGRFASRLALQLALAEDGGIAKTGVNVLALWSGVEAPDAGAGTAWELCDVPIPGLVDVPVESLNTYGQARAEVTHLADRTRMDLPEVVLLMGAMLDHPASDPLPADASRRCSDQVTSGCVVPDPDTGVPGVAVNAAGLDPDVDIVNIDLRMKLGVTGILTWDGQLDGTVTAATFESHVLACHLRGGGNCSAADVARVEAAHPRITVTGGTMRSHLQSFYFTCPQLADDPEGSVTTMAEATLDAGLPDMAGQHPTFAHEIQSDLDARGCATGGCHETFTQPGQMHLVFKPKTQALVMQNYQAALPWTQGKPAGGRFVNQVPLPPDLRARWLTWIASGSPF